MNFLLIGGAGSVGRELTSLLLKEGQEVKVLDRDEASLGHLPPKVEAIHGNLEDKKALEHALSGVEVICHLAWSFSDDPLYLLDHDLKGHIHLLEAASTLQIKHFIYTSSAIVYGKPSHVPLTEEAPCLVDQARKPIYAVAKQMAENLTLSYGRMKNLPVTVFRFWWSFGEKIGGRHLKEMLQTARQGAPLSVPARAGGSFLHHEDLLKALLLVLQKEASKGQIFNLATQYFTWEEIAQIIKDVTQSSSPIEVVPADAWRGAAFLADLWELSTEKAERVIGYKSSFSKKAALNRLREAMGQFLKDIKKD